MAITDLYPVIGKVYAKDGNVYDVVYIDKTDGKYTYFTTHIAEVTADHTVYLSLSASEVDHYSPTPPQG